LLAGISRCDGAGGVRCEASGPASVELCSNGVDDDCDGAIDVEDGDCAPAGAPDEGAAAASAGSDGALVPEPSAGSTPVVPPAPAPNFTPVRGNPGPSLERPSAASLGGGGGCQLQPGARGSLAPGLLLLGALLARSSRSGLRSRRAPRRLSSTSCPKFVPGSPPPAAL
jgi:hypothetical protein